VPSAAARRCRPSPGTRAWGSHAAHPNAPWRSSMPGHSGGQLTASPQTAGGLTLRQFAAGDRARGPAKRSACAGSCCPSTAPTQTAGACAPAVDGNDRNDQPRRRRVSRTPGSRGLQSM
jgi:hypothetical protein